MQAAWREVVSWTIAHPWGATVIIALLALAVDARSPRVLTVVFLAACFAAGASAWVFRGPRPGPDCYVCGSALEPDSPACPNCGHVPQADLQ